MTSVTHTFSRHRRARRASWPAWVAIGCGGLWLCGALGSARWPWVLELLAIAALVAATTRAFTSGTPGGGLRAAQRAARHAELERAVVALIAGFVLEGTVYRLTGSALLHPLLYGLLAWAATRPHTRAHLLLGVALALELGSWAVAHLPGVALGAPVSALELGVRALCLGGAAIGGATLVGGPSRGAGRANLLTTPYTTDRHAPSPTRREEADAHDPDTSLTLLRPPLAALQPSAELGATGSEGVDEAMRSGLTLLRKNLRAHTCALLWLDADGKHLHVRELLSDHRALDRSCADASRGALAGVIRRGEPVVLRDLRPGWRGLPFYPHDDHPKLRHALCVPLRLRGDLVGVIVVDRLTDTPFSPLDVDMIEDVGGYIAHAVSHEHLIDELERQRRAVHGLYNAACQLNGALTAEQLYPVALDALDGVVSSDFAALTRFDAETGAHTIVAARAHDGAFDDAASWVGRSFTENGGLVCAALRTRQALPVGGQIRQLEPVVFGDRERLCDANSLRVTPLLAQDEPLGALIIAHRDADRFADDTQEMLQIIAHQIATSLHHAQLYARMETMATRDALTGLANRRVFMERLDEAVARHRRQGTTFGLLLTDIDHFKSVNDTHGHPVGDAVLREVAAAFRDNLRTTDLPARYGGEEFVIILEDTDLDGSVLLAERLREAIKALTFSGVDGPFHRTISMGVAIWPQDHEDPHELIELADQALYRSKKGGRDRVTAWRDR